MTTARAGKKNFTALRICYNELILHKLYLKKKRFKIEQINSVLILL